MNNIMTSGVWIDESACIRCGLCVRACVRRVIAMGEHAAEIILPERCCLCGHCSAVCKAQAVHNTSLDNLGFEELHSKDTLPTSEQYFNLVRMRRSIRIFSKKMVSHMNIEKVLNASRYAPSASNRQPLQYVVKTLGEQNQFLTETVRALEVYQENLSNAYEESIRRGEMLSKEYQARLSYQRTFAEVIESFNHGEDRIYWNAPILIVCHIPLHASAFPHIDAGVALMQMLLMAETLGLGTCICGLATIAIEDSQTLRALLDIPIDHMVLVCFVIGHPAIRYRKLIPRNALQAKWY